MSEKLVLIDGNALVHRAFHALPDTFTAPSGEPTNATYGFTSMLLSVLNEEKPDYVAVAFDVGRTFRHEEYPEYKAQRGPAPDALRVQMERVKELVQTFNIPIFELEGYEADDILGTLSRQAAEGDVGVLIVTGDTDAFQLIGPRVKVLTHRGRTSQLVTYDEAAIRERYGLSPQQLIDLKGLSGDASDNIPGVRGIGQKTATRLLQEYASIEEIYAHLGEMKSSRFRRALEEQKQQAFLSKHLVTIVTDMPIQLDLPACRLGEYNRQAVLKIFRDLGFQSLAQRLPEPTTEEAPLEVKELATHYETVTTPEALKRLAARLRGAEGFAFDVETTSLDPMAADLVGLCLSPAAGEAYYIPVGHFGLVITQEQLPLETVLRTLGPLFADPDLPKYAHNANYDITVLSQYGLEVRGLSFDTMVAAWLIEPSSRSLGLKDLAADRLGFIMQPITKLIGTGRNQVTMAQVPIEDAAAYGCADADATFRLVSPLSAELDAREQRDLFTKVEMPLVDILVQMQLVGVALDTEFLKEMSTQLYHQIRALEKEVHHYAGRQFNVNSTKQLGQVLFEDLKLPVIERTRTRGYSTAARVLEELKDQHAIIPAVLKYRELTKLKSTYLDALPLLVNPRTGRVHTSYNQTGTVTGRISSSNPNLQNIPIRSELGREIRRAFVAAPGCVLLGVDYSQIDLRVLAHISGEPNLVEAFRRGEDIHASTASAVYRVPLKEVTPEQRRLAKTVNFAIVYGVTGYGLAQQSDLTQEEAGAFIESYFAQYPGVRDYMERIKAEARERGYVSTLLGRRRYFPQFTRPGANRFEIQAAERAAINSPVQGSAADIIKLAMIELARATKARGLKGKMILQVHDELIWEVPEEELEELRQLAREIMEGIIELSVPLKVDVKVGPNWAEMV